MNNDKLKLSTPENTLVATRIVNAPRELVFKAWTTPEHHKNWWGPNGFTNTFHIYDLRPGGKWSFIMHGPDGKNYTNESVFVQITSPELLVFDHISEPLFQVRASFEDAGENKTRVIFKMIFDSAEECANLKVFIGNKNEENLDRLEAELKRMG